MDRDLGGNRSAVAGDVDRERVTVTVSAPRAPTTVTVMIKPTVPQERGGTESLIFVEKDAPAPDDVVTPLEPVVPRAQPVPPIGAPFEPAPPINQGAVPTAPILAGSMTGWSICSGGRNLQAAPPTPTALRGYPSSNKVNVPGSRIRGGVPVKSPHTYPWMTKLLVDFRHSTTGAFDRGYTCGGTILNDGNWIMTAAHCLMHKNPDYVLERIRVSYDGLVLDGTHQLEKRRSGVTAICATGYDRVSLVDDIGLIRLDRPIDFTQTKARPATLASKTIDDLLEVDPGRAPTKLTAIGFGRTGPADGTLFGGTTLELMEVDLPVVNSAVNGGTVLLARAPGDTSSACVGDSGGPAHYTDLPSIRPTVVGVTSYSQWPRDGSPHCQHAYAESGFTRVFNYLTRIESARTSCGSAGTPCAALEALKEI